MGFNPKLAPYSVTLLGFNSDPAADKVYTWFRFPERGMFVGGFACNDAAIATATNMVACFLVKYATDGTTEQGTIGSVAETSTWAAGVPRAWTVTSFGSTAHFAQSECVMLKYDEITTGLLADATFQLDYVLGYFA
jgi:hypothetical protein